MSVQFCFVLPLGLLLLLPLAYLEIGGARLQHRHKEKRDIEDEAFEG
jgi:hypothetical protein